MKILVLAALIAAASSGRLSSQSVDHQTLGPWRPGTLYKYDVVSYTLATLTDESSGSAFKARFVVRAQDPGHLIARLENPQHAQIHQKLPVNRQLPADLKYEPVSKLDQPFEITINGGRVVFLNLPVAIQLAEENILKALISAFQLDLTSHRHVPRDENAFDEQTQQGMFKKMETDVTGDCETMYNVYPAIPEWRRELPNFANDEEPIMISKTKNYGHCHHRVDYHFGVPQGAEWAGTAHRKHEDQFIRRATVSRMLAGKQGPIYKTETTSTVHVNPQVYGNEKAEVLSHVQMNLVSYEKDDQPEWQRPENNRRVNNLLYAITRKQVEPRASGEAWDSNEANNQNEHRSDSQAPQDRQDKKRMRRSAKISQDYQTARLSHSSSESESASTFVNDDLPKNNEPAYAAMYMAPQVHTEDKQNPINAQRVTQEMAQLLQNPNNMPKGDFLSKFNYLVRIISSMNSAQLNTVSRSIEVAKSSPNKVKADMFMIYRDAVAQAGTLPAFQQIKTWILNKKLQGEEAAQVVASLVKAIRYPTKDIMVQFFKLAISDEVREQKCLNSTALIAATRFINMAQVNNETAHSYYPTHMYGRLSRKDDSFVQNEIVPILSQRLKEAIQQGDSNKAQVYIKAIGNLGHRSVLQVFAPYLEGKIPTTTYLRTLMVRNLQVLAHQKDDYARAVLFSIIKNQAESYEVRVAAVDGIFMARPSTPMMQAMAQMTHSDPSVHIRAVLKSAIESAAELKNPHYLDLARTAQAAKWMLTKQNYGDQYSSKMFNESMNEESDLSYISFASQIGSEDSVFPKYMRYSYKSNVGGWNKEESISTSFTSLQRFISILRKYLEEANEDKQKPDVQLKYTTEKISEMLNIKRESQDPLEAALLIAIMGQERYYALSENDFQQLPSAINKLISDLAKDGYEHHYTKVLNDDQISIMFPVGSGMPFIYKYKVPVVVHVQSKVKLSDNDDEPVIKSEVQFTYARNIDGRVGFMDTLSNKYASVGVLSKFQLYVPLKMQIEMRYDKLKMQMEPLRADQDNTIVHYSVWPYSSKQNKDSTTTVGLDQGTKVITPKEKVVSVDSRFGREIGNEFQLQGYSYSSDYKNLGAWMSRDMLENIENVLHQKDVALTHFNFRYLGKHSRNNRVTLTALKTVFYNQKQPDGGLVPSNIEEVTADNEARREMMVKRVGAGINLAKVKLLDLSVTIDGEKKHEYVFTAAMANSKVDNKIQYAFFAARNSEQLGNAQVNGIAKVKKPEVTSLNFREALQKDMKMEFSADIRFGQEGNILMSGYTERSKRYVEELREEGRECTQQNEKNNYYQTPCYKMIVKAHAPDQLKASISYKELSPAFKAYLYKFMRMADHVGYRYSEFNPMKTTADGKVEIESQLNYTLNSMNLILGSRYGDLRFTNVPIPESTSQGLAVYPPISSQDRLENFNSRNQYQPFCTVDGDLIKTFSNRQYQYRLTRSWHVVVMDDGRKQGIYDDQLVVLARRPNEKQQEIYISYKESNGNAFEMEIQPAQPNGKPNLKVKSNAKKVADGDLTMYWNNDEEEPLLEYYTQPDGVLMVNIMENRLRAMYDGDRLVVFADDNRNKTRGLCGHMSGEARDDYQTPYGYVDKPEHYGASFALNTEESDPKTVELQSEAKKLSYPPKKQFTKIPPAGQYSKNRRESKKEDRGEYKTRSYLETSGECEVQQQMQYYEDHSQICVTTERLPACQSRCKGEDYEVQEAQVVCGPKKNMAFRTYRDQIRSGENPQLKGAAQKTISFRVPRSCRA